MSRADKAKEYFKAGYTCSQAVALAFADLTEVEEEQLKKLTLPFGGGIGRLRLTCGAVSGMVAILGLLSSNEATKSDVYGETQTLCKRFEKENGSLVCGDLLTGANLQVTVGGEAEKRTDEYYKKRPCAELVYSSAKILEEYIETQKNKESDG
jgi:C_GCAxxG_C_C family probable redox protein